MLKLEQSIQVEYQSVFYHFHTNSIQNIRKTFHQSTNINLQKSNFYIIKDQLNIYQTKEHHQNSPINLQSLFNDKNITFNESKKNYLNSFVPKLQILFKYKLIIFKVTKTKTINPSQVIPHQNSVNSHLFKPRYREQEDFLECYVPTEEIMIKTLVGVYQIFELHKIPHPMVNFMKDDDKTIQHLIGHWTLENQILFCRIESLLTFLLIQWLQQKRTNFETIKSLVIELQSSRLKAQKIPFKKLLDQVLQRQGFSKTELYEYFQITEQSSQSIFFYGANFTYKGKRISAVMLPWGLQLANELIHTLYSMKSDIKKVTIIGGVGFTGKRDCQIDDIFIPNSCIIGHPKNFQKVSINNGMIGNPNAQIFTQHNVIEGCIRSVFPQLGKLQQTIGIERMLPEIDAIEMEFQAIYKCVAEKKSDFGAIFYVMDNLYKNIHLGSTYYDKSFLEGLFKKFERGKLFCYEKALNYLAEI